MFHWIATFLDQIFKNLPFLALGKRSDTLTEIKDSLYHMYGSINENITGTTIPTDTRNDRSKPLKNTTEYACFQEILGDEVQPVSAVSTLTRLTIWEEIDNYRNLTIDTELLLLLFWGEQRQFTILQQISRRVLIIQLSSAESERSFSVSGNILTSKRCRMK